MHFSRRRFLALSAAAGAATALPGCTSSTTTTAPAPLPAPSQLPITYLQEGDPAYPEFVADAEAAAAVALTMVQAALDQRTFAVGGVMVENSTGRVITAMHNNVIRSLPQKPNESFTWDPTAHGERQLVNWYYANRESLALPRPEDLTVVTSLDPCAQCAGSLMTAGFRTGVIAYDDVAGVNYDLGTNYSGLPRRFRSLADRTFGYYAIQGRRPHTGSKLPVYSDGVVSQATADGCDSLFIQSRDIVAQFRKTSNREPGQMTDPATLPADSPVRTTLTGVFPQAFSIKLTDPRRPTPELEAMLVDLRDSAPDAENAVALIDPFGNLVGAAADAFEVSPISTALQNVVQGYSQARFLLAADPDTQELGSATLTNPRWGTLVWLHAPSATKTTTIKDLGIYDLTIEGEFPPGNFQYYRPPLQGSMAALRRMIAIMGSWTDPADPQQVR